MSRRRMCVHMNKWIREFYLHQTTQRSHIIKKQMNVICKPGAIKPEKYLFKAHTTHSQKSTHDYVLLWYQLLSWRVRLFFHSVSCTGNRHPILGDRTLAVTMICWLGTALGCRRRGPAAAAKWQLKMASTFKRLVIWRSVFLFFWN